MAIKILGIDSDTELYCHFSGQTSRQDCFVELDLAERTLTARYSPEIGNAVPMAVWHGHIERWDIPALRADAANRLLADIAPLAERMCDGYESRWDGSNHMAELDADAREADGDITALTEACGGEGDECVVWTAEEWIGDQTRRIGVRVDSTDAEIEALAESLLADATLDGIDDVEGLEKYLEEIRDHMRAEASDAAEDEE